MVFKEKGISTKPWPFQTELTLCNENANHLSQMQPLQMCEFAVKLLSDGGIQLQFSPAVFLMDLIGTAFPVLVVRAAEARREHWRD